MNQIQWKYIISDASHQGGIGVAIQATACVPGSPGTVVGRASAVLPGMSDVEFDMAALYEEARRDAIRRASRNFDVTAALAALAD